MFSLIVLLGVDSSYLGRPHYASMPHQALMEMFVEGITNKEIICGSKEEPKDIEEWNGVTLNENEGVSVINWSRYGLEETLSLEWLPPSVQEVNVLCNKLTGKIDLEILPVHLKSLNLGLNKFSGTVCLTQLPDGMEVLNVSQNQFSGTIDVTSLPFGMKSLYLTANNFWGSTDFSNLPKSLEFLLVSNTNLEGQIHLEMENPWFMVGNSKVKIVLDES